MRSAAGFWGFHTFFSPGMRPRRVGGSLGSQWSPVGEEWWASRMRTGERGDQLGVGQCPGASWPLGKSRPGGCLCGSQRGSLEVCLREMGSSGLWGGRPLAAAPQQNWLESMWGVWPLGPRAALGPADYEKRGFLCWACGRETACMSIMGPSVDCPSGPGLGAQPRRFQNGIRSTAAAGRKRRGGKGRRPSLLGCFALGACLFLSLLRVRQAVSGCRRGGGMPAAGSGERTSGTAAS